MLPVLEPGPLFCPFTGGRGPVGAGIPALQGGEGGRPSKIRTRCSKAPCSDQRVGGHPAHPVPSLECVPSCPVFCAEFLGCPKRGFIQGCHHGGRWHCLFDLATMCSTRGPVLWPLVAAVSFPSKESQSWRPRGNFWEGCEMDTLNVLKPSKTKGLAPNKKVREDADDPASKDDHA